METELLQLNDELILLKIKKNRLQKWLRDHHNHPDFLKIAGDRNALIIKIDAVEYKIGQLKKRLPILGEPEEFMTIIELEKKHHKNK